MKSSVRSEIRLRGVRHNNLKNFDLDLPLKQLIVITGLSGSGKSSLAFDTLFAEGQRRYIETFSPYARQFFDRMDKPKVDRIEGIPPAIAIEQRNAVRTTRSTVGTMTEICDYMKMLWLHIARLHCRQCHQPVRKDSPQQIWQSLQGQQNLQQENRHSEVLITFELALSEKLSIEESLGLIARQGYQRLLIKGEVCRLEELPARVTQISAIPSLTIIQDRLQATSSARPRFIEACEQAYHFGKGKLAIHEIVIGAGNQPKVRQSNRFSNRLHCAQCDVEYREPVPALFSFNNPLGACPTCRGFGRVISIDYNLALPDRSKTLAQGAVKPWQSGQGMDCQRDLLRMCRHFEIPVDVPFEKLAEKWQRFVIEGEPDYGKDEEHEWPRAWYGIKGYFRWLESRAYKMHVRVLLSRYRAYTQCPECKGKRFQPEALLYRVVEEGLELRAKERGTAGGLAQPDEFLQLRAGVTLADFYQFPVRDALAFVERLSAQKQFRPTDPLGIVLHEVRSRLGYLNEVGLGYLTLDRPTRSLSGGETERVNLTTCLGTCLVNTLFVLDEPSVGLHPRDTERLVRILERLRDTGNTVVVVEHEPCVMRAADQIVDLGPGHGATGGEVVFQGSYREILKSKTSLTGRYLNGTQRIEIPERRWVQRGNLRTLSPQARTQLTSAIGTSEEGPRSKARYDTAEAERSLVLNDASIRFGSQVTAPPMLMLVHASRNNLRDLTVEIPLGRLVCVTGVSGSGKTTLIREVLLTALGEKLKADTAQVKASDRFVSDNGDEEETPEAAQSTSISGWEHLSRVLLVDQSILGKTPRSNPAVYIGAFDEIRELFAQSELAKQRGLNASAFSFNSSQGQCERCRGAGFEKIEMQFLSDVFIRCPDCDGSRYRPHILEVKIAPKPSASKVQSPKSKVQNTKSSRITDHSSRITSLSIADLLASTIEEAIAFLVGFPDSRPAQRAVESLQLLSEVGLGYLKLGQPINTLSGGECQRLKLVKHLAEVAVGPSAGPEKLCTKTGTNYRSGGPGSAVAGTADSTMFLFDEPTTGLHFDDVRLLLKVFQRLVDAGHSVVVIEHNLEVIKCADWLIDLGPDAGDQGGQIVAEGTPEDLAACAESHTGAALRQVLEDDLQPESRSR